MRAGPSPTLAADSTLPDVDTQADLEGFLGVPRFETYRQAAGGDIALAADLCRWNTRLSGALHAQISYLEVAVRNALDQVLGAWNSQHPSVSRAYDAREWTRENAAVGLLYHVLGGDIREARRRAKKEADRRERSHPRQGVPPNHGDVVAQLMFGSWCKLLRDADDLTAKVRQSVLWHEAIHTAFPRRAADDASRLQLANRLDRVRRLRNRVAHHDSLLGVDINRRLNDMLAILADVNPAYPGWAMEGTLVRKIAREDPRKVSH